jgi:uncharacterized protein (TIGR03545 family)
MDKARGLAQRYSMEPLYEKKPRFEGQDIRFPVQRGYPELWIKQLRISGGTDRSQDPEYIYLQGLVENVSSDQRIAGVPLTIQLEGTRGGALSFGLSALLDRRSEVAHDEYTAHIRGVQMGSFHLGKTDFLPTSVNNATLAMDISLKTAGTAFQATGDIKLRAMDFAFQTAPKNIGEKLARDVLAGVSGFDAGFRIWRENKGMDAAFTTDLDDQFAAGVKRVVGAELVKLQNQIRDRVEKEIAAKRAGFDKYFAAKRDEVQKQLDTYKSLVDENKRMIDERKKELEARLEQVKKGAVNKVMDKILKKG